LIRDSLQEARTRKVQERRVSAWQKSTKQIAGYVEGLKEERCDIGPYFHLKTSKIVYGPQFQLKTSDS